MSFKYWGNTEYQHHIRQRKLGSYNLYIYRDYASGMYVLQEEYAPNGKILQSQNVTYDTSLTPVLMAYNNAIKEYNFYRGERK